MKSIRLLAWLLTVACIATAASASSNVDMIGTYWGQTIPYGEITANLNSLALCDYAPDWAFAVDPAGGVAVIAPPGGTVSKWGGDTQYTSVATIGSLWVIAAKASGGFDLVQGASATPLSLGGSVDTTVYDQIAPCSYAPNLGWWFAANPVGGIDVFYYDTTGVSPSVALNWYSDTKYSCVAASNTSSSFVGIRADGTGLDLMANDNATRVHISDVQYTWISTCQKWDWADRTDWLIGCRASGGIDLIKSDGSIYQTYNPSVLYESACFHVDTSVALGEYSTILGMKAVPEPSSLVGLGFSMLTLIGFVARKRS